ncbi:hypothetical protein ACROYT_G025239 [Oculina patagonica]
MSSLITAVFEATIGLLASKDRVGEAARPKEGDIADENIRDYKSIVREIDEYVMSKLDGLARADLRTSISCFKEGIANLFKILDNVNSDESYEVRSVGIVGAKVENLEIGYRSSTAAESSIDEGVTALKFTDLNELEHKTLLEAKQSFKASRRNAKDAFNNEALGTLDRIQAMTVRVAATILENVDFPEDTLAECNLCLEELHSLPEVKKSFTDALEKGLNNCTDECREIIYTVCHVNRVIYDVTQMISKGRELLTWPCIDNGKDKIDPLRDGRLTTEHSVAPWSFGHQGEEEHALKRPRGIAINTDGQFIVGDNEDCNLKVFDSGGKFLYTFPLQPFDTDMSLEIQNITIGRKDTVYVLVKLEKPGVRGEMYGVYASCETAALQHRFNLREGFRGWNLAVDDNNRVLVLGRRTGSELVEVYDSDGEFVLSFGKERFNRAEGIAVASDGRVLVVDTCYSYANVFSERGEKLFKIKVKVERYHTSLDVAFHRTSEHVVVVGKEAEKDCIHVQIYNKDGEFVRSIEHVAKWVSSFAGVTVTVEGRTAVVVLSNMPGVHSKVLVL